MKTAAHDNPTGPEMLAVLNAGQTVTLQQGLDRPVRKGRGNKQGRWGSKAFEIFERLRAAGWITIIEDTGKVYDDGQPAPVVKEVLCGKVYYEGGDPYQRGWHQTVTFRRSDKNPVPVADTTKKNPYPNRWRWERIKQAANLGDVEAQRILAENPQIEFKRQCDIERPHDEVRAIRTACKAPEFTPIITLPIPRSAIVVRGERSTDGTSTYKNRGRHVAPKRRQPNMLERPLPTYTCNKFECRNDWNCKHVIRKKKVFITKYNKMAQRVRAANAGAQTAPAA